VTIQKASSLYICALVVVLPLAIAPGIDEFALLPRLLVYLVLTLGLSIWTLVGRGTAWQHPQAATIVLAGFWGILGASALWAINPFRSTFDLAKHIPAFVMFLLLTRYLAREHVRVLLTCHSATGLLVSVVGIAEYFDLLPFQLPSTGRPSATFAFRNLAGAYLATGIPLAALTYWLCKDRARKALGLASASAMCLFLLYTRARSSWFGLLSGLTVASLLWLWTRWKSQDIPSWRALASGIRSPIVALSVLVLALGTVDDRLGEVHTQRFDEKKEDMATTIASMAKPGGDRGRFLMWGSTLDLIADHPIIGVGLGNWEYVFPPYDGGHQMQATSSPHRPHNDVLWIWSEMGTIGLIVFSALLFVMFAHCTRSLIAADQDGKRILVGAVASMVAFLGVGMFSFPFERVPPEFHFWLAASIAFVWVRDPEPTSSRPGWLYGLPVVLLGALLVTIQHTRFDWLYSKAHVAYLKKDKERASEFAERALGYGPFDHQAYLIVGDGAYQQGNWQESEKSYRKALRYHPHFPNAFNGLGLAALGQEDYQSALNYFNKTLSLVPAHHIAQHNKGLVFEKQAMVDSAEVLYRQAFRDYHGAPLVNLAAIYRKKGMVDSAIALYQRATTLSVPSIEAYYNLGNIYLDQRDFVQAGESYVHFLNKWTERDSAYVAARQGLGQSYSGFGVQMEQRGQVDSARAAYERALEIDPEAQLNWFNLGNVLRKQNDMDQAILAYQEALALDPNHIDSYNNLGMTYRDLKRDQEAIAVYEQARQIAPKDAIVNYNLGQVLMVMGQKERAEEMLRTFKQNWDQDPILIHYYMGNVYAQSGDTTSARREYRAFLAQWKKDDGIRRSAQGILNALDSGDGS